MATNKYPEPDCKWFKYPDKCTRPLQVLGERLKGFHCWAGLLGVSCQYFEEDFFIASMKKAIRRFGKNKKKAVEKGAI
jgi:hypothetical protein